jgi:hypothetical protein
VKKINKGRYRRRTPDRQHQGRMREVLKQRVEDGPVRLSRDDIGAIGADIGLEETEAARLFDRLKGVSWRGDYVTSGDDAWEAAWVREVN